jgi:hypothetical protein
LHAEWSRGQQHAERLSGNAWDVTQCDRVWVVWCLRRDEWKCLQTADGAENLRKRRREGKLTCIVANNNPSARMHVCFDSAHGCSIAVRAVGVGGAAHGGGFLGRWTREPQAHRPAPRRPWRTHTHTRASLSSLDHSSGSLSSLHVSPPSSLTATSAGEQSESSGPWATSVPRGLQCGQKGANL